MWYNLIDDIKKGNGALIKKFQEAVIFKGVIMVVLSIQNFKLPQYT